MTAIGALPGRKPFRRAVREILLSRCATSPSTCSAGIATSRRRSSPPVAVTETCISIPSSADRFRRPSDGRWCERRDSNSHGFPHWNLNPARLPVPPLSRCSSPGVKGHARGGADYSETGPMQPASLGHGGRPGIWLCFGPLEIEGHKMGQIGNLLVVGLLT